MIKQQKQILLSKPNPVEKYCFFILLIISLLIIIIPKYYVTGDGPSHLYNAKVFLNILFHRSDNFFKQFYELNRNLDPNYTSQLLLGLYNKLFPVWLADKAFQITYVFVFAFGFRYLLNIINPSSTVLSLLFYPFCFTFPFQTGFYNYSLAIGILFFVLGYFIKTRQSFTGIHQLFFTLSVLLLSATHGMVATHGILICSLIILFDELEHWQQKYTWMQICNHTIPKFICMLPAAIIILAFTLRQGLYISPHPYSYQKKLFNFLRLYCCQSTIAKENIPSILLGIGILIFTILIIWYGTCENKKFRNIYLIFTVFTFWGYMNAPDTIGYVGGTDIRMAFLPPLFLLITLSTFSLPKLIQNLIIGFSFFITIFFIGIRFNNVISASVETENLLSVSKNIESNKTVLAIQYNTHGSRNQIELDNSFLHIFDYIGAIKNKSLIILNNYEADLPYFSMHWKTGMNPHSYMPWIIDGKPPLPSHIIDYENGTKQHLDYIIWQDDIRPYNTSKNIDSSKIELKQFLLSNYICIDSVPKYGVLLFKKNYTIVN